MHLSAFRYRLPLTAPLVLPGATLTHREGVLVRLDGEGGTAWGDAAPLPGFSRETLDDVVAAARELEPDCAPPSLRFALEVARGAVAAPPPGATLALNAVWLRGEDADAFARRVRSAGYVAAKVKVGVGRPAEDAARVRALRAALGPDVALRLDANRAWAWDDAVAFGRALAGVQVEYVEEPLAAPERLAEWAGATGLPFALDESLLACAPGDEPAGAAAYVLKPTLLGGIEAARAWASRAAVQGAAAVVSSCFESGVGTRALALLACELGGAPAGLEPYARLARDVVEPPLPLSARVDVDAWSAPRAVRMELLEALR